MGRQLRGFLRRLPAVFSAPIVLSAYFSRETGAEHRIGFLAKLRLLYRMVRNNLTIVTASNFLEHVAMAVRIWSIPPSVPGCVVECGCFKGGSTANLSLICALCDRRLHVFDSFEGLPEPGRDDRAHKLVGSREIATYEKGSWAGSLEEVRSNVGRFGRLDLCTFHRGYFADTLPGFGEPCVFVYVDADLRDSVADCLRHLWPLLAQGGYFFTHEAPHMEIAFLFFDRPWWRRNLGQEAPGLIGAGTGLGLVPERGLFGSGIGYAVKNPDVSGYREVPQTGL